MFSRHCIIPTVIKAPSPFTSQPNSFTVALFLSFFLDICLYGLYDATVNATLVVPKSALSLCLILQQHIFVQSHQHVIQYMSKPFSIIAISAHYNIKIPFLLFLSFVFIPFSGIVMLFITWIVLICKLFCNMFAVLVGSRIWNHNSK